MHLQRKNLAADILEVNLKILADCCIIILSNTKGDLL